MIRLIYQGRLALEERKRESLTEQSKEEQTCEKYGLGVDGEPIYIYIYKLYISNYIFIIYKYYI